jgi:[ribosomal protein S18]-alanine N-acetyltransferase
MSVVDLNFTIQLAKSSDMEALYHGDKLANETFWSKENYVSSLHNSQHLIYVAKKAGEGYSLPSETILGALVMLSTGQEIEILQLWVLPMYRRCKIAKSLLYRVLKDFCISSKKSLPTQSIFLEVNISNQIAIYFYQSIGFCQVGVRKNYYCIDGAYRDALVMKFNPANAAKFRSKI